MSKEEDNKAVVGRWFTEFWGKSVNLGVVDEIAAPDMLLKYSLHEPRRGRDDIKAFMTDFRAAFPDLNFWGTAELIAEGDYVVGQWEGGGTHHGPAFGGGGRWGCRGVGVVCHASFPLFRPSPSPPPPPRDRPQDALHRHHRAEGDRWPDRPGNRP